MDLKNDGLKHEIVKEAFAITHEARLQILDEILLKAIPEPRHELAKTAPKMIQMQINPDKIREVIGSGGKVIQKISADCNVKIDINEDGRVAGGTISYYGADAKFYDGIVMPIIQSIQFK